MTTQRSFPLLTVLLLWCAGLGAAAQFAKIAVPLDAVQALFPLAGAGVGWLLTLVSAVGAALGLTAGLWVARIGCARALVLALALGGVVSLWQATLPSFPVLLASRLGEGLSHLLIVIAAPTLIAQISSDRTRNLALTLWSTFFGVAFVLFAWLAPPVVAAAGLSGLWALHGVLMFGLAALLLAVLGWPPGAPRPAPDGASVIARHAAAYASPRLAAPALGWLFYTLSYVALLAVLPGLLSPDARLVTASLMPLASIVVSLAIVPLVLRRVSAVRVVVAGFALSIAVIALIGLGVPLAQGAVALFAALGLVQGASFAAVAELNRPVADRALANGALAQSGNIGNLLGTRLLLGLLAGTGAGGMLAATALLYLAGIAGHVLLARRRRSTPP